MKLLLCGLLLVLSHSVVHAQQLPFEPGVAVKAPESVLVQLRRYVEEQDGTPMGRIGTDYPYLPVYNVLAPKEKRFGEGVYCFIQGVHYSGEVFIYRKGKTTVLGSGSTLRLLTAYTAYLQRNPLPETIQLDYLSAITAFAKYYYRNQRELVEAGALEELK